MTVIGLLRPVVSGPVQDLPLEKKAIAHLNKLVQLRNRVVHGSLGPAHAEADLRELLDKLCPLVASIRGWALDCNDESTDIFVSPPGSAPWCLSPWAAHADGAAWLFHRIDRGERPLFSSPSYARLRLASELGDELEQALKRQLRTWRISTATDSPTARRVAAVFSRLDGFVPRPEFSSALADWLGEPMGWRALHGPPGTGKSSLMAWLAASAGGSMDPPEPLVAGKGQLAMGHQRYDVVFHPCEPLLGWHLASVVLSSLAEQIEAAVGIPADRIAAADRERAVERLQRALSVASMRARGGGPGLLLLVDGIDDAVADTLGRDLTDSLPASLPFGVCGLVSFRSIGSAMPARWAGAAMGTPLWRTGVMTPEEVRRIVEPRSNSEGRLLPSDYTALLAATGGLPLLARLARVLLENEGLDALRAAVVGAHGGRILWEWWSRLPASLDHVAFRLAGLFAIAEEALDDTVCARVLGVDVAVIEEARAPLSAVLSTHGQRFGLVHSLVRHFIKAALLPSELAPLHQGLLAWYSETGGYDGEVLGQRRLLGEVGTRVLMRHYLAARGAEETFNIATMHGLGFLVSRISRCGLVGLEEDLRAVAKGLPPGHRADLLRRIVDILRWNPAGLQAFPLGLVPKLVDGYVDRPPDEATFLLIRQGLPPVHVIRKATPAGARDQPGHRAMVNLVTAGANGRTLTGAWDGEIREWDGSARVTRVLRVAQVGIVMSGPCISGLWLRRGMWLVAPSIMGSNTGGVRIWDPSDASVIREIDAGKDVTEARWHPGTDRLVVLGAMLRSGLVEGGQLDVLDLPTPDSFEFSTQGDALWAVVHTEGSPGKLFRWPMVSGGATVGPVTVGAKAKVAFATGNGGVAIFDNGELTWYDSSGKPLKRLLVPRLPTPLVNGVLGVGMWNDYALGGTGELRLVDGRTGAVRSSGIIGSGICRVAWVNGEIVLGQSDGSVRWLKADLSQTRIGPGSGRRLASARFAATGVRVSAGDRVIEYFPSIAHGDDDRIQVFRDGEVTEPLRPLPGLAVETAHVDGRGRVAALIAQAGSELAIVGVDDGQVRCRYRVATKPCVCAICRLSPKSVDGPHFRGRRWPLVHYKGQDVAVTLVMEANRPQIWLFTRDLPGSYRCNRLQSVGLTTNGEHALAGDLLGCLYLRDARSGDAITWYPPIHHHIGSGESAARAEEFRLALAGGPERLQVVRSLSCDPHGGVPAGIHPLVSPVVEIVPIPEGFAVARVDGVDLWRTNPFALLAVLPPPAEGFVQHFSAARDAEVLACTGGGAVTVWVARRRVWKWRAPFVASAIALSPDGKLLAVAGARMLIILGVPHRRALGTLLLGQEVVALGWANDLIAIDHQGREHVLVARPISGDWGKLPRWFLLTENQEPKPTEPGDWRVETCDAVERMMNFALVAPRPSDYPAFVKHLFQPLEPFAMPEWLESIQSLLDRERFERYFALAVRSWEQANPKNAPWEGLAGNCPPHRRRSVLAAQGRVCWKGWTAKQREDWLEAAVEVSEPGQVASRQRARLARMRLARGNNSGIRLLLAPARAEARARGDKELLSEIALLEQEASSLIAGLVRWIVSHSAKDTSHEA